MDNDLHLVKNHETGNHATITIIKSVLDSAEILYMIPGEYDSRRGLMEVLINEKDEPTVRELLSFLKKE